MPDSLLFPLQACKCVEPCFLGFQICTLFEPRVRRPGSGPRRPSALPSAPTSMGSPRGVPVPCTATYRTLSAPMLAPSRHEATSACTTRHHVSAGRTNEVCYGLGRSQCGRPGAFPSHAPPRTAQLPRLAPSRHEVTSVCTTMETGLIRFRTKNVRMSRAGFS